jgi:hypothetical protein
MTAASGPKNNDVFLNGGVSEGRARGEEAQQKSLKAGVAAAIEAIDGIIEDLADEHEIAFEKASMLVHIGIGNGNVDRVIEDPRHPRPPPSIGNAYRFCRARVEDGRCQ